MNKKPKRKSSNNNIAKNKKFSDIVLGKIEGLNMTIKAKDIVKKNVNNSIISNNISSKKIEEYSYFINLIKNLSANNFKICNYVVNKYTNNFIISNKLIINNNKINIHNKVSEIVKDLPKITINRSKSFTKYLKLNKNNDELEKLQQSKDLVKKINKNKTLYLKKYKDIRQTYLNKITKQKLLLEEENLLKEKEAKDKKLIELIENNNKIKDNYHQRTENIKKQNIEYCKIAQSSPLFIKMIEKYNNNIKRRLDSDKIKLANNKKYLNLTEINEHEKEILSLINSRNKHTESTNKSVLSKQINNNKSNKLELYNNTVRKRNYRDIASNYKSKFEQFLENKNKLRNDIQIKKDNNIEYNKNIIKLSLKNADFKRKNNKSMNQKPTEKHVKINYFKEIKNKNNKKYFNFEDISGINNLKDFKEKMDAIESFANEKEKLYNQELLIDNFTSKNKEDLEQLYLLSLKAKLNIINKI